MCWEMPIRSICRWQPKDLSRIDAVGIVDMIPVRRVDHRVAQSRAVRAPRDPPQAVARKHGEKGIAAPAARHLDALERNGHAGRHLAAAERVDAQLLLARGNGLAWLRRPGTVRARTPFADELVTEIDRDLLP